MPLYRCRYLDSTGSVIQTSLAAKHDAEAIEMAQNMGANSDASWLELWQGERCIRIMREPGTPLLEVPANGRITICRTLAEAHTETSAHHSYITQPATQYGAWTDHQIPEDRSGWHPAVRRFYEYWLSVTPPGRLPGRQHIRPEEIGPLLPRLWMVDVFRDPMRFRYRLAGTSVVQSVERELTGRWLDEAQPEVVATPMAHDRYRFVAETGRPAWRRGPNYWKRDPKQRTIENCMVPLAVDGVTVDRIFAVSVAFDADGREIS
jgi:hypothetical protein